MPNPEGLAKLVRVLTSIERQWRERRGGGGLGGGGGSSGGPARGVELRLQLVVPSHLEHDTAWRRVQARSPLAPPRTASHRLAPRTP